MLDTDRQHFLFVDSFSCSAAMADTMKFGPEW